MDRRSGIGRLNRTPRLEPLRAVGCCDQIPRFGPEGVGDMWPTWAACWNCWWRVAPAGGRAGWRGIGLAAGRGPGWRDRGVAELSPAVRLVPNWRAARWARAACRRVVP